MASGVGDDLSRRQCLRARFPLAYSSCHRPVGPHAERVDDLAPAIRHDVRSRLTPSSAASAAVARASTEQTADVDAASGRRDVAHVVPSGQTERVTGRIGVDEAVVGVRLEVVLRRAGGEHPHLGCDQVVDVEVQVHLYRRSRIGTVRLIIA